MICSLASLLAFGAGALQADDKPAGRPSREELREKLRNLSPEEKEALIKEWREKQGDRNFGPPPELREKLKNLPPEEREAKMKEWREKQGAPFRDGDRKFGPGDRDGDRRPGLDDLRGLGINPEELKDLSPEERRVKVREAAEKRLADLKKKQAAGTLTVEEERQLDRMLEMQKRFEEHRRGLGEGKDGRPPGRPRPEAK